MKMRTLKLVLVILVLVTSLSSCKKNLESDNSGTPTTNPPTTTRDTAAVVPYPQQLRTNCPGAPVYSDTIFYVQPSPNDYIVSPINKPDSGSYFAWPAGLIINKNTGAINISKSEGGLRYNIGYVKKGTQDTCVQSIVLAGVSYVDSLYILSKDQRLANPYFDADATIRSVCDPSGGPGGNKCEFDVDGQAAKQHVVIDHKRGVIDLKGTAAKAFGLLPLNGTTVTTTMAYKLNDKSKMAPQKITISFIYYNTTSDIPADLLNVVTTKLNMIAGGQLLVNLPGAGSQQMFRGNPRPPIIIVTRFAL